MLPLLPLCGGNLAGPGEETVKAGALAIRSPASG